MFRIIEMIDTEIQHAYDVGDISTAATLQALSLEILDEFDLEVPLDNWDAQGELQKIIDTELGPDPQSRK